MITMVRLLILMCVLGWPAPVGAGEGLSLDSWNLTSGDALVRADQAQVQALALLPGGGIGTSMVTMPGATSARMQGVVAAGGQASLSLSLGSAEVVSAVVNRAPRLFAPPLVVTSGSTVALMPQVEDPDGDVVTLTWGVPGHGIIVQDGLGVRYRSLTGYVGSERITVTARDRGGAQEVATQVIEVRALTANPEGGTDTTDDERVSTGPTVPVSGGPIGGGLGESPGIERTCGFGGALGVILVIGAAAWRPRRRG